MLVLAPVSSVAWAAEAVTEDAEPSPERLAQARRLFAEGQLRMERGEWVAAGKRFREAARIKDTPGLRYYMAVCEESLGRLLEAQRQYEEARRLLDQRPAPDVEELIRPALVRIDQKIPQLTISLSKPIQPSAVLLDGKAIDGWMAGQSLRVDPGEHSVRVEFPGHEPFMSQVVLEEGERHSLWVHPLERPASPLTPDLGLKRPAKSSTWRTVALVGGVTASAAGMGLGIWGVLERRAALQEAEWASDGIAQLGPTADSCTGAVGSLRAACDDLESARRRREHGTGLFIGGMAAFGAGVALTATSLFLWPESSVEVIAVAGGELTGVRLGGQF